MSIYEYIPAKFAVVGAFIFAALGYMLGWRRERQRWTGRF